MVCKNLLDLNIILDLMNVILIHKSDMVSYR